MAEQTLHNQLLLELLKTVHGRQFAIELEPKDVAILWSRSFFTGLKANTSAKVKIEFI